MFRLTVTDDTPLDDYDEANVVVNPVSGETISFGIRSQQNL